MRKKFLLGCISIVCMSALLTGCGKDKDEDKDDKTTVTTETVETTEIVEDNTIEDDSEEFDYSKYVNINEDKTKIEIDAISGEYSWEIYDYGCTDVKVDTKEEDSHVFYTITPVNKLDYPIVIDLFGIGDNDTIYISFEISIDSAKEMTCSITKEVTPIYVDEEQPSVAEVSQDLIDITESVLDTFEPDDVPGSLATNALDMTDADMMQFCLGVDSLSGAEEIAITEPMMSSVAFSLVTIRFDSSEHAKEAVSVLESNAPTGKWVCVTPEAVKAVVVDDNYVVFLMGSNSQAAGVETLK